MKALVAVVFLLAARPAEAAYCGSVAMYGATANDDTPDQVAFQTAIDSCAEAGGGEVTVPAGTYLMSRHGGWAYYTVSMANGVHLKGASRRGSVLKMAPNTPAAIRMFYTRAAIDAAITDMTLDGAKADHSLASEHRHGVMADGSTRLRLERLNVKNFTGDGLYLFHGAVDTTIRDVDVRDNLRNGITLGGQVTGVRISDSVFAGSAVQQIDSEPSSPYVVSDVSIRGCRISGGDFAIVVAGTGSASPGHGWQIVGNTIDGPVYVVWASRVAIVGNIIRNHTLKPGVDIYRTTSEIVVADNTIEQLDASAGSYGVRAISTGVGNQPDHVVINGNAIRMSNPNSFGVDIRGVLRATVVNNTLLGAGASTSTYGAIRARATTAMRSVVIAHNTMSNFSFGVLTVSPELIGHLSISGNVHDNGTTVGATP
jgi:hypothetical protein